jgi:sugar/nucleoside kinase (ribokinase family)
VNKTDRPGLAVYGDIAIDLYIRTSFHPGAGQDAKVDKIIMQPGGSAANCAAVAAHLGVATTFIGFIGTDSFAKILREDLGSHGVSLRHLKRITGDTGIVTTINDASGERTFFSYRGVNAIGELSKLPQKIFSNKKILHISGYSFQEISSRNNSLFLIKQARQAGTLISIDPSFWHAKEYHQQNPQLLADVDIIFPNQDEAELLSGSRDPAVAARILHDMGPEIVVITLGAEGCYLSSNNRQDYFPAIPVAQVVDTNGAGDAFCAGFLAGQIFGLNTIESAKMGNAAASIIIRQIGGHTGAPALEDLCAVLIENHEVDLAQKILSSRIQA